MTRPLLLAASLVLLAPSAHGQLHLAWDDCGAAGSNTHRFACDANTGPPASLVISVMPEAAIDQFVGVSGTLVMLPSQDLPDWWRFDSGACRAGALSATTDFASMGPWTCVDPWGSQGLGGFVYEIFDGFPVDGGRMRFEFALPVGTTTTLEAGVEHYLVRVNVARTRTTGVGACAGCSVPVCVQTDLGLYTADFDDVFLSSNWAYWQPASVGEFYDFETGRSGTICLPENPTPAAHATWGTIKRLYR